METADETQPLMAEGTPTSLQGYSSLGSRANGSSGALGNNAGDKRITLQGVVGVLAVAFTVFTLASVLSRAIIWKDGDSSETVTTQNLPAVLAGPTLVSTGRGLINPLNGTHPTLTSTPDCTGDLSMPVLAGADVVAYFSMPEGSKPAIARGDIRSTYRGYLFFFSSVENKQAFESDPSRYLPAWGGFCTYGIASEKVWTAESLGPFGDPSKWKILSDGRLHVFRSLVPMEKFSLEVTEYLDAGNARWDAWFQGDEGPLNTACFCSDSMCNDA